MPTGKHRAAILTGNGSPAQAAPGGGFSKIDGKCSFCQDGLNMGGYGSGWQRPKKTVVEDCLILHVTTIRPYLGQPGYSGWVSWSVGGRTTDTIGYQVAGDALLKLRYTLTKNGEKQALDYCVGLTFDLTPWGARRYWFTCPAVGCGRRVGALYLPPGGRYFACRHCYRLTYRAAQEANSRGGLAAWLARDFPELTRADALYMMAVIKGRRPPPPPAGGYFARRMAESLAAWLAEAEARAAAPAYPGYLSAAELCDRSGLAADDLARLEAARLLLPDTQDGRYRPKLAGWARKLAYLLAQGWQLDELRRWARGRWSTANPRAWPPDRDTWKQDDTSPG